MIETNDFNPPRKWLFWLAVICLAGLFLFQIRSILLPFVVGAMIAYFLDPAADELERRGLSRTSATAVITLSFFAAFITVMIFLAPALYHQLQELVNNAPEYAMQIRKLVDPYVSKLHKIWSSKAAAVGPNMLQSSSSSMFETAEKLLIGVLASGKAIFSTLSLIFLTPVVTFYMLRDWDVMVERIDDLLPRMGADIIRTQAREIDRTIAAYLRGQVNVCMLLSLYYMTVLWLAGLQYGLLVGLIAGIVAFIPFVGTLVTVGTAMTLAFIQFSDLGQVGMIAGMLGFGIILENNILVPKLIGGKVGLHPAWVIFGMLAGGALLGFVGVLLAVPLTAAIGVIVRFATARYRSSAYYSGIVQAPLLPEEL